MDFLTLKEMYTNEIEKRDLKEIADCIAFSLGSIDQSFDLVYAFNSRVQDEKKLEDAEDRS